MIFPGIMMNFEFYCSQVLAMIRSTALIWIVSAANSSLLAAVASYRFVRNNPPEIFAPRTATNSIIAPYTNVFVSTLSSSCTLALGLIIGVCASIRSSANLHCLMWTGLALCLDLSRHRINTEPVSTWIGNNLPGSIWTLSGSYWSRGVFHPMDLLTTVMGGSIAFHLLTHLSSEKG